MTSDERAVSLQFKHPYGNIQHLDCTDVDTASAHYRLGKSVREQIRRILCGRLEDLADMARVNVQIRQARRAQKALQVRLNVGVLDGTLREALEQYQTCLSAWAGGASLAEFTHPLLAERVDDLQVGAEDLAIFLQEDEVGCQTGSYREQDGAVILWHTEEDYEKTPGERFDTLRLFSFRALGGRTACGFIYPDLLPGPSFGWQAGFAQAIDTLHVKSVNFEQAILPNSIAWLSLYLGGQVSRAELVKKLVPFRGGYSLTAACKKNGRVDVEKVEFANDEFHASRLERPPGSYLFQTNVIHDLSLPIGAQEQTSTESRAWNEKRNTRSERFIQVFRRSSEALPLVFRMLCSRLGGDSAYANHDVKAYFVCRMTSDETRIWVGCGAPMPEDDLFYLHGL